MPCHVRGYDHVDHHLSDQSALPSVQIGEYVEVWVSQRFECNVQTLALQTGFVAVAREQLVALRLEVSVLLARMTDVVNSGRKQGCNYFQLIECALFL